MVWVVAVAVRVVGNWAYSNPRPIRRREVTLSSEIGRPMKNLRTIEIIDHGKISLLQVMKLNAKLHYSCLILLGEIAFKCNPCLMGVVNSDELRNDGVVDGIEDPTKCELITKESGLICGI